MIKKVRSGIKSIYQETSPLLWILALVLWTIGACLVVVGVIGDSGAWWADRPFLTNLISSLAGAFFGIPVALIVLQRLAAHQAGTIEKVRTIRLTIKTLDSIAKTLETMSPNSNENIRVMKDLRSLEEMSGEAFEAYRTLMNVSKESEWNQAEVTIAKFFLEISKCAQEWSSQVPPKPFSAQRSVEVRASWDFFRESVTPSLIALDTDNKVFPTFARVSAEISTVGPWYGQIFEDQERTKRVEDSLISSPLPLRETTESYLLMDETANEFRGLQEYLLRLEQARNGIRELRTLVTDSLGQ